MKTPVFKSPIFWSAIVLIVLAADCGQLLFGISWLKKKAAALKPPMLTENLPMFGPRSGILATTYKAKPGEWQVPQFDPSIFDNVPPQVTIVPSKFGPDAGQNGLPQGSWGMNRPDKAIGVGMPLRFILQSAYRWRTPRRIVLPDQMPGGQYDFIANLTNGALEALQVELKNKFGLVAARETRPMDALVLRVNHADAPGLKPGTIVNRPIQSPPNTVRFPSGTMATLGNYLESVLGTPVLDQTGLTGNYDIQFPAIGRAGPISQTERVEQTRKVILEQLGLDLIPTNAPVEMLIVRKVD